MSRLDWCQNVLLKHPCYDWKNDNCDGCNIFQAYCEGAARAKKTERTGEWIPVKKVYRTNDVDFPNTHIEWETATEPDDIDAVRCSKCGEVFDFEDARNWCTECGAKMGGDVE